MHLWTPRTRPLSLPSNRRAASSTQCEELRCGCSLKDLAGILARPRTPRADLSPRTVLRDGRRPRPRRLRRPPAHRRRPARRGRRPIRVDELVELLIRRALLELAARDRLDQSLLLLSKRQHLRAMGRPRESSARHPSFAPHGAGADLGMKYAGTLARACCICALMSSSILSRAFSRSACSFRSVASRSAA